MAFDDYVEEKRIVEIVVAWVRDFENSNLKLTSKVKSFEEWKISSSGYRISTKNKKILYRMPW